MKTVTILDGYIDEPACLGVPPYLSPYPRYIAGALLDFDPSLPLNYLTIDRIRSYESAYQILTQSSHMPKQLDPDMFSASQAVA